MTPDPWSNIEDRFPVGSKHEVKVKILLTLVFLLSLLKELMVWYIFLIFMDKN